MGGRSGLLAYKGLALAGLAAFLEIPVVAEGIDGLVETEAVEIVDRLTCGERCV